MRTERPWPTEPGDYVITLAHDEYIHCPCSHHRVILGPGTVTATRWRDGGLDMDHGSLPEVIWES